MSTTEWVQEAGMDSDTSSVSVASYAQTAQAAAESATASESAASASALIAAQRADDVASANGYRDIASATALIADSVLTYLAGENQVVAGEFIRTRSDGFVYEVAAAGATDQHLTTAGGVKLYVLAGSDGKYNLQAFGDTDDTAAFEAAHAALPSTGGVILVPEGAYELGALIFTKPTIIEGLGFSAVAGGVAATQLYKAASVSGAGITFTALNSGMRNIGYEGLSGNVGDGIVFLNGRSVMQNVSVHGMGNDGVRAGSDDTGTAYNCNHGDWSNVICRENGRHGGYLHDGYYLANLASGANCNNIRVSHWDATSNGGDGLRIYGGWYNMIESFLPQSNGGYGLNIIASGSDGARYNTVVGGEQNEGNTSGEIYNSGLNTVLLGVTPGTDGAGLIDVGLNTIVVSPGLSKFDTLRVLNILTSERPTSGSVDYPLIAKSYGNVANGRGAGIEFQVPNGSGTARVGGRISAKQETTNNEVMTFSANKVGVITDYLLLSALQNMLAPVTDNALSLGKSTSRFSLGFVKDLYLGTGVAKWTSSSGSPEGAVTAPVGSMYTRTDGGAGSTLYVKESGAGNTGWVAK